MSKKENDFLNERIKKIPSGNFQNYARVMLLSGETKYVDYSELKKVLYEINRIGNNINQIARLANLYEEISREDIIQASIDRMIMDKQESEQVMKKRV